MFQFVQWHAHVMAISQNQKTFTVQEYKWRVGFSRQNNQQWGATADGPCTEATALAAAGSGSIPLVALCWMSLCLRISCLPQLSYQLKAPSPQKIINKNWKISHSKFREGAGQLLPECKLCCLIDHGVFFTCHITQKRTAYMSMRCPHDNGKTHLCVLASIQQPLLTLPYLTSVGLKCSYSSSEEGDTVSSQEH